MKRLMHPTSSLFLVAVLAFSLPFVQAAEKEPPPHPSVGQRFVPEAVDWSHPVCASTFDNDDALADWKLEGGKRMSIANGKWVLESNPSDPKASPEAYKP